MKETKTTLCPECGEVSVAPFVHYGSYFTRCTSCGYNGPATSWLAIAPRLTEQLRAVVVDADYQSIEFVGEGVGADLYDVISTAASQGKLILLSTI